MNTDVINQKIDLINYYDNSGNYKKQLQVCREILVENPTSVFALKSMAGAYYELNLNEEFLETCLEALKYAINPSDKAYLFDLLAAKYSFERDYEKAIGYHKEVIENNPNKAEYLSSYAKTLFYLGRKSEADKLMAEALNMDPNNMHILIDQYVVIHDQYNDREKEQELLTKMLKLSTDPFRMNIYLGNFHMKYYEYEDAYDYYIKAVLINPNFEDLNMIIIECENQIRLENLNQELFAELHEEKRKKILSYIEQNNYKDLQELCNELLKNDQNNITALWYKAVAAECQQRYYTSKYIYLELMGTKMQDYTYEGLGRVYFNLGKFKKAIIYLKKAIEFDPRNIYTQYYYMRCLAEVGEVGEALTFMESSVYYATNVNKILACRFIIQYKFKDSLEDELETLKRLEISNVNSPQFMPQLYMYYALTYEKYGQFSKALDKVNEMMKLGVNNIELQKIYKRIQKSGRNGGLHGRIRIFSIIKGKKSGRRTYPLSAWKII